MKMKEEKIAVLEAEIARLRSLSLFKNLYALFSFAKLILAAFSGLLRNTFVNYLFHVFCFY